MYENFKCVMWKDGDVYCCHCARLNLSSIGETEGEAKYKLARQIGDTLEELNTESTLEFIERVSNIGEPFYISKMNIIAMDEDKLFLRIYDNEDMLSSFGFWPFVNACKNILFSKYDKVSKFVDKIKE